MRARSKSVLLACAAAAVILAAALGAYVRAGEALSTRVVPAEDPYTHMAFVRGHLADGSLDPLHDGGTVYPPGLHSVLSSYWVYTGLDLHDVFLVGPIFFGVISVLGIAFLLWRFAGPVAGVVGALAVALAPEEIFRTTMMSPTALDLAMLPFLLFALARTVRGELPWAGAMALVCTFLVISHPWLLAIVAPVTLGMVVLSLVMARDLKATPAVAIGGAVALAVVGGALGIAVNACYSQCGLGFQDIAISGPSTGLDQMGNIGALVALGSAGLLLVFRRAVTGLHHRSGRFPVTARLLLSLTAAGALVAVTLPAVANGMPEHVDLPRMFGWPILALGIAGLLLAPWKANRAALLGVALVTVTYPFVIHNPLDSPYWPHRTAAYFGIGLVILAGTGAAALVRLAAAVSDRLRNAAPHARPRRNHRVASVAAGALPVVATVFLAGSVYAGTPLEYEGGWYRLYPECEFDMLQSIAARADADTVVIVGDWRPKLVAAAYAENVDHVWFSPEFFSDPEHREDTMIGLGLDGRDIVVVVDRHMRLEQPDLDTSFLRSEPWTEESPACTGMGITGARMLVYNNQGVGA